MTIFSLSILRNKVQTFGGRQLGIEPRDYNTMLPNQLPPQAHHRGGEARDLVHVVIVFPGGLSTRDARGLSAGGPDANVSRSSSHPPPCPDGHEEGGGDQLRHCGISPGGFRGWGISSRLGGQRETRVDAFAPSGLGGMESMGSRPLTFFFFSLFCLFFRTMPSDRPGVKDLLPCA